jgi:hypothetical protein
MTRNIIIKFSLIDESDELPKEHIIQEIKWAFRKEQFVIPWIKKIENISIKNPNNPK